MEMIIKKISAARINKKDGKSMRVYFTPLAVPLLTAIPIRKQQKKAPRLKNRTTSNCSAKIGKEAVNPDVTVFNKNSPK